MPKKNSSSIDFPPQKPVQSVEEEQEAAPVLSSEDAEAVSPVVERGVTNFYGPESLDATPKEIRHRFKETASRAENMVVADMHEQQERVKEVTKEYFAALRADQQARGSGSKILEDLTGLEGNKKTTKDLRNEWLRARAHFAFTQSEALDERLRNRPRAREEILEGLRKYKGKGSLDEAKVRARYERMVTVRTVVMGAEEAELAVKMEGLNSRDKKSIDRFYDRYKKLPPAVRIFGTSAALLGLTTGAGVILGGAMIGIVPLGMAGTSAALRFFAEKNNNRKVKQWLGGISKFASIGGAFGALMNYGVTAAHGKLGTEGKAQEVLRKNERLGMLSNVSNLESISQKRKESLAVKENIARQGRWARIAGSIGAGALFGHLFSHGSSTGESTESPISPETSPVAPSPSSEAPVPTNPRVPVEAPLVEVAPSTEPFAATIDPGEGMSQLFVDLRTHYGEMYPDPTNPSVPPGIRHLLEAKDADSLSREFHFINENNASYVMKVGDTLGFNEEGSLVFTPKASPDSAVTLLERDVSGELKSYALTPEEQQGHFDARPTPRVATPLTETPEAAGTESLNEREITAQLNRDALQGEAVASLEPVVEKPSPVVESTYEPEVVTSAPEVPVEESPQPVVAPTAQPEVVHDAPVPEEAVAAPVEAGQPFYNNHDVEVSPLETRVYSAADDKAPGGEQLIVFGGGDARDESFLSRVQEVARANPGRKVYFDAGYLVDFNGTPQKWINAAVYDPQGGMRIGITPEGPEMIGVINPDSFTRKLQ